MLELFSSRGCIPLSTASGVSLTEVVTPGTCLHQESHWQRGWHQEPACRITFLILCSVPQPWVCCFLCEPKLTISRLDLISRLWWPLLFCPLVLPHLSLQPWTCCFLSRFVRRRASPQSLHYTTSLPCFHDICGTFISRVSQNIECLSLWPLDTMK